MLFKCNHYCLEFRSNGVEAGQHIFVLKCIKIYGNFNMYVHMQCAHTCEWPGQYLDGPSATVEEGVVAVPAQGPDHPQELLCCLPSPATAPASVQCSLQQLPAGRPSCFFHFLWCSWCFRVADYSRPVAKADCCCCPSPCWPQQIVQQSTGLLKPLIEWMVGGRPVDKSSNLKFV